jgi:hypothetical protein
MMHDRPVVYVAEVLADRPTGSGNSNISDNNGHTVSTWLHHCERWSARSVRRQLVVVVVRSLLLNK